MLSKIVKVAAVLVVVGCVAAGVETYRVYQSVSKIVSVSSSRLPPCSRAELRLIRPGLSASPGGSTAAAPGRATKLPACEEDPKHLPTLGGKQRINILLLGSDNDKKGIPLLSQTMMVVSIDPIHKSVVVLSIPRDLWGPLPGVSTVEPGVDPAYNTTYHKIDEAMSYGAADSGSGNPETRFLAGVKLARATVEQDFGITIDYYAWVGLTGFVRAIDTLGGVVINAMHPIVDDAYPDDLSGGDPFAYTRVYIPAGPQYMDGSTALEYTRSRHADLFGDFGRGARQEQMLLGIRRKTDSLNITDLQTILKLLKEMDGYVKSDIGSSQVLPMYSFERSLNPGRIKRVVLSPPKYSEINTAWDGQSIVTPFWGAIDPLIRKLFVSPLAHSAHPSHRTHKVVRPPTLAQAAALLRHVVGAGPPIKAKPKRFPTSGSESLGRLFFDEDGNIWVDADGTVSQITHRFGIRDPSVTPNGRTLVYAQRWQTVVSDIFEENLSTGHTVRLTNDGSTDGNVADNVWAFDTAISPDGKTVIYASDAYKLTSPTGAIDLALYRENPRTGTATQISSPALGAGGDADPRFDPANPNFLVYAAFYYQEPSQAIASRLMLLNLRTDQATPLTPYRDQMIQPAWAPSGNRIAYIKSWASGSGLLEASYHNGHLDVAHARRIDSGMVSEPVFSPNGRFLAYFKLVGNQFQIWLAALKNGWPTGAKRMLLARPGLLASSPLVWTH